MLYPLKFIPLFFPKIWGGKKIKKIFLNAENFENIGEAWTLSAVEGSETVAESGFLAENNLAELSEVYLGNLLGDAVFEQYGSDFPLLVKVIDAAENLSIQVHPNDELAAERHNTFGKNEMWYMLDCEPEAHIIAGFNRKISEKEYLRAVKNNVLEDYLKKIPVKKGDAVFIPAGCVHSIGKGCTLLEIQQSSDITYRIYDYNRVDKNGKKRELHTDFAIDAIDFDNWENSLLKTKNSVIKNEFFTAKILDFNQKIELDLSEIDSFVLLCAVEKSFVCVYKNENFYVNYGETLLIPAEINCVALIPSTSAKILEVFI
ncbi:MAG: class I mannose-6-phosphate isomerase [Prevotellaceae bacterium]|jgi:mannose-6-phosphate isomerase|nr:class I mannose-6-phosphate isomerase [Prevotellaceae bacterium]